MTPVDSWRKSSSSKRNCQVSANSDVARCCLISIYTENHNLIIELRQKIEHSRYRRSSEGSRHATTSVRFIDAKDAVELVGGPSIILIDNRTVLHVYRGDYLDDTQAHALDCEGGDISRKIETEGSVKWNTPGIYNLAYRSRNRKNLVSEVLRRQIVIRGMARIRWYASQD